MLFGEKKRAIKKQKNISQAKRERERQRRGKSRGVFCKREGKGEGKTDLVGVETTWRADVSAAKKRERE